MGGRFDFPTDEGAETSPVEGGPEDQDFTDLDAEQVGEESAEETPPDTPGGQEPPVPEAGEQQRLKDLETKLEQALATIGRQGEELDMHRQYLRDAVAPRRAAPAAPQQPPEAPVYFDPAEDENFLRSPAEAMNRAVPRLLEDIRELVRSEVSGATTFSQYQENCRKAFYDANPDLSNHARIVGVVSAEVGSEYPDTPPHLLLDEVATRTRQYIEEIREAKKAPPPTKFGKTNPSTRPPVRKKAASDPTQEGMDEALKFLDEGVY